MTLTEVAKPEGRNEATSTRLPFPLFVLVGGVVSDAMRAASADGSRPRADVLELERISGHRILHFDWLSKHERSEWSTRLVSRTLGSSWSLALRALREIDQACIYTTGEDIGIPLGILLRLTRRQAVFVATRFENPDVGRTPLRRLAFRSAFGFALGRLDLVFCRSKRHMRHLEESYGFAKTALGCEVNDTEFYDPARAPNAPSAFTMPDGPFILSAGLELRDYRTLIEAVRDLPVRLVIGAGSPWSHFRFDSTYELPPNVQVAKFAPDEMRRLYSKARLVVVPVLPTSRTCGVSVVLEAFAMRKPVIVTKTGGLDDYVTDGVNVLEVEPQSPQAMRQKIELLLSDETLANELAARGHALVRERFGLHGYPRIVADTIRERGAHRVPSSDVVASGS